MPIRFTFKVAGSFIAALKDGQNRTTEIGQANSRSCQNNTAKTAECRGNSVRSHTGRELHLLLKGRAGCAPDQQDPHRAAARQCSGRRRLPDRKRAHGRRTVQMIPGALDSCAADNQDLWQAVMIGDGEEHEPRILNH